MTKTTQLLEAWNCEVAKVLSSWGDGERLAGAISRMIRSFIPCEISHVSMWGGVGVRQWVEIHRHPADLEIPEPPYPDLALELDPFIGAYVEGRSGSLSLHELAPAGFQQSAYYQHFYLDYGFSDVLVHLTRLPERVSVWTQVARAPGEKDFTKAERELHEAMFPAVEAFSARIADLTWNADEHLSHPQDADLETALQHFGEGCLTERESTVVRLVLCGHNTQSVASMLGIATETAKLHRKHAYAKLRVGSQGELFYRFLQSLDSHGPSLGDAPPAISRS